MPLPADLNGPDMIARMETARGVIESRFLDTSDVLSGAVDGIAALVAGLEGLAESLNPASLARTTQQLEHAAATLTALPAQHQARGAAIATLAEQRAALAARLDEMRRSLAYMRAFTVSIKITAAGIPGADAEFGVFAQEISTRVEAGHGQVAELERSLAGLQAELKAAVAKSASQTLDFSAIIPAVPAQLLASAGVLAAQRGKIGTAIADTAALARAVRKKVGRILGALQIGDITRQRVEHVQTGITLLALEDVASGPARRMRAVLAALLAAQLSATLVDFNREVAEISAGLAGLAVDAAALLRLRELAYGGEDGGFLRTLEQRVSEAAGPVAAIEAAAALTQDTGRNAARAAQVLSDRLDDVQSMKSDVFYMALNTTLKSARLGDAGRALSTIAVELRSHAGYLDVTATSCVAGLLALTKAAATLAGGPAEASGAGAALTEAMAHITAASASTEQEVEALAAQGEAVLGLLSGSRLDLQQDIGGALDAVARDLAAAAAGAVPCDDDIKTPLAALFARLAGVYTMAQEREVQAEIEAAWGLPASAAVVVVEALEDALF